MKAVVKRLAGRAFRPVLSYHRVLRGTTLILMYHRVLEDSRRSHCDPALYVTPSTLEMHLKELRQHFEIVSLESALERSSRRLCAVTFDDGWRDNYQFAFPVLKRLGVPATIFLTVHAVGGERGFWFQRLWEHAAAAAERGAAGDFTEYFGSVVPHWRRRGVSADEVEQLIALMKQLPAERIEEIIADGEASLGLPAGGGREILDWDEIAEMGSHGISFGSHGLRHHLLTTTISKTKKMEISDSQRILKERGVAYTPFFSYPNGNWDEECMAYIREDGYRGALTTRAGFNTTATQPLLLNRLGLHEETSNTPTLLWFNVLQAALKRSRTK